MRFLTGPRHARSWGQGSAAGRARTVAKRRLAATLDASERAWHTPEVSEPSVGGCDLALSFDLDFVRDLVDADPAKPVEGILAVMSVSDHPRDDRPNGAPRDPHQSLHRRAAGVISEPGNLVLEHQGMAGPMPGPGEGNHDDSMFRTPLIESLSHGVPAALVEVRKLGRTPQRRAADILAYFDRPGSSNGPTEAINGRLEHLRGSALGFRNLTNYVARSLLEAGGFRPQLHHQL